MEHTSRYEEILAKALCRRKSVIQILQNPFFFRCRASHCEGADDD